MNLKMFDALLKVGVTKYRKLHCKMLPSNVDGAPQTPRPLIQDR